MFRLLFMGDSTMQQNFEDTFPQVGWPQALPLFLRPNVVSILNFAHNGCSTKSFKDLGYFDELLKHAKKGDYCFIEFGHNDEKENNPLRYARPFIEYKENLNYFIDKLENKGVTPILLTPVYRRMFKDGHPDIECHKDYPQAMAEVAKERGVFLIDVTQKSMELLDKVGFDGSRRFYMNFDKGIYDNFKDGLNDNSHLRFDGAYEIAKIVVQALYDAKHPLRDILYFEEMK